MAEESKENKTRWTITIDPELGRRLDAVCEAREQNRSEVIERIIKNAIVEEEGFVAAMEDPLQRVVMEVMQRTPGLLAAVSRLVLDEATPERIERMRTALPVQIELGKRRQQAKKQQRKGTQGKEATA